MHTDTASGRPPSAALESAVGALTLRLESVEHRVFPALEAAPVGTLPDGTEVARIERDGELFLVVDHRRDPARPARVELWRPLVTPEEPIAGLYALCEAL